MKDLIMIVDDEPNVLNLAVTILQKEGYEVIHYASGEACLERLQQGNLPDLIILDMFMPRISGKEVLGKIRNELKLRDQKVIFFTVAKMSENKEDTLKALDVADYITKPFNNNELVQRVKKVLKS